MYVPNVSPFVKYKKFSSLARKYYDLRSVPRHESGLICSNINHSQWTWYMSVLFVCFRRVFFFDEPNEPRRPLNSIELFHSISYLTFNLSALTYAWPRGHISLLHVLYFNLNEQESWSPNFCQLNPRFFHEELKARAIHVQFCCSFSKWFTFTKIVRLFN